MVDMNIKRFQSAKESHDCARRWAIKERVCIKVQIGRDGGWYVGRNDDKRDLESAYKNEWLIEEREMCSDMPLDAEYVTDVALDDTEHRLLQEEILEDQCSYSRSNNDGWYYEDK
jgi:hypothetical protein